MSESHHRRERTITVETSELGPVQVRRLSLGGMARIAERMRADDSHDEIALGNALVAEVIVAGLESDQAPGEQPPDAFGDARLALLSEQDRRSIAAAVLTLEGVKAAGDDVLENPLSTLARRYSHVLDTRGGFRHADSGSDPDDGREPAPPASVTPAAPDPQIALFADILPPPTPAPAQPAGNDGPASAPAPGSRGTGSSRAAAWDKERVRLEQQIDELQMQLAQQLEQQQALDDELAYMHRRADTPAFDWRRYRWPAAAALALLASVLIAQTVWIASLRGELEQQRETFQTRLTEQQKAVDSARLATADAKARVAQLEKQLAASKRTTTQKSTSRSTRSSSRKSSASKQPARSTAKR